MLLSVCVVIVMFMLFRSYSFRGYTPNNNSNNNNPKTGDTIELALNFDDKNSDNSKLRTSNGQESELSRGED